MEQDIKNQQVPLFKDKEVIVIQYLESSMSNELLSKFPDGSGSGSCSGSGFGFDYSQSSIWSPLVPRFHSIACLNPPKSPGFCKKKLCFDKVSHHSSSVKKKFCTFGLNFNAKFVQKKKMLKCNDNNNPAEIKSPPSKKCWKKVLKMTSKQFKRKKDHHGHRHPISRVTLADYLQCQDF